VVDQVLAFVLAFTSVGHDNWTARVEELLAEEPLVSSFSASLREHGRSKQDIQAKREHRSTTKRKQFEQLVGSSVFFPKPHMFRSLKKKSV
jgi:hypothetical protein